jgi:hypothetical protein
LAYVIRSGRPFAPILGYNPEVAQARKVSLNIDLDNLDLDNLDHRVVGEAFVERVGHLIEIVEDTTRTTSARRAASRELRLLMSVLCKLIERPTGPPN